MKWFAVKYVYQIVCGDGHHSPQFNEQLRLIHAFDLMQAKAQSKALADTFNKSFVNYKGEPVYWKFLGLKSISEIVTPAFGAEIYSEIIEPADVNIFLKEFENLERFQNLNTQI